MTDVINDEKPVVDSDAAQPQPGVAGDELVRQLVVRNGCHESRAVTMSARRGGRHGTAGQRQGCRPGYQSPSGNNQAHLLVIDVRRSPDCLRKQPLCHSGSELTQDVVSSGFGEGADHGGQSTCIQQRLAIARG